MPPIPELTTHRAYGLPKPEPTPEMMTALETTRINPDGILPEPLPVMQAAEASPSSTATSATPTDQADMQRQWPQLKGQFLIDRDGVVRWANIECSEGLWPASGKFPSREEILTAARALAS